MAVWVACLLAAGCQIFPRNKRGPSSGWEHNNLYNSATPHAKLFVEIDAVEGQGPTPDETRMLEEFLRAHCDKPGGIVIKVDSTISAHRVLGRGAELLAAEYAQGPPDADSAFLYILFYNTRLREKGAEVENPAFAPAPFPIVYIDRGFRVFGNPYGRTYWRLVLLHETAHALGLCAAESHHATAGHCTNAKCLMQAGITFNIPRFLTLRNPWENRSLCDDCRTDLARYRVAGPNPKLDFWHG